MGKINEHRVIILTALVGVVGVWLLVRDHSLNVAITLILGIITTVWTVTYPPRKVWARGASVSLIDAIIICSAWVSPDSAVESMLFGLVASCFISVRVYPKSGLLSFLCILAGSAIPIYHQARAFPLMLNLAMFGSAGMLMLQTTEVAAKLREFRRLSIFDDLTRLHTVRYFRYKVEGYFRDPKVGHVSLCILDVDRFKEVNDLLGHREGDHVLQRLAREIQRAAHPVVVSRYGGEEFVIAMPNTSIEHTVQFAEKIRQTIEQTSLCLIRITLSCGVASLPTAGETPEALFDAADRALYQAKLSRNCVRVHGADTDEHAEAWLEAAPSQVLDGQNS